MSSENALKENAVEMCLLFDFYGAMLTQRQQEIFDLYYNDDLSLSEISEQMQISRQAVRDSVTRSKNLMIGFEQRLGLVRRFQENSEAFQRIHTIASELLELNRSEKRSAEFDLRLAEIYRLTCNVSGLA
ncbi:MAG: YlxM family DNA-binding protein [Clostridiales bacterium]|nr:YlxM family DNA-binding protein [Clostridiales bacterium]MDD7308974.1 YlxM family DNA-binding protein [Eubacteriales bacterium]MDY5346024.1 YlxM family DNA-binding protein [Eubacteriales bacterium]